MCIKNLLPLIFLRSNSPPSTERDSFPGVGENIICQVKQNVVLNMHRFHTRITFNLFGKHLNIRKAPKGMKKFAYGFGIEQLEKRCCDVEIYICCLEKDK
jgi:hypothetical protein